MLIHRSAVPGFLWGKRYVLSSGTFMLSTLVWVVLSTPTQAVAGGVADDAARGKQLFEKRCGGCHSLDKDGEGPRLRNVYGRKAGSVSSFQYSSGVKSAGITWDDSSLNKWLTGPDAMIPDADMDFQLPKADERAEIIRYLKTISNR